MEGPDRSQNVEVGLYVGGVQTRTVIQPNGLSASWEAGDELALWARNSAGEYTLENQLFKMHGYDDARGFFTSTLPESMPQGRYTYISCYPYPASVNGTKAVFNIPETYLPQIACGYHFEAEVPALDKRVGFEVVYISAEAAFATQSATSARGDFDIRTFEVKMRPLSNAVPLREGMSVIIDLEKPKEQ